MVDAHGGGDDADVANHRGARRAQHHARAGRLRGAIEVGTDHRLEPHASARSVQLHNVPNKERPVQHAHLDRGAHLCLEHLVEVLHLFLVCDDHVAIHHIGFLH